MATYVCTIAGATKTLQQGWTIRETANGRAIFSGGVLSADASYRPAIGAEVLITEDGTRIFGGNIDTPSESGAGGFGITPIVTRISAVDFNALADRRFVINGGFVTGHTLLQCVTDLNGYLSSYGVTVDAAQVTGPSLTADIPYDVRSITSILDELCLIFSGQTSTSFVWHIDYDKKLRVYTIGTYTAPVSITTANRFAEGDVSVEPSRLEYGNRIYVLAGTGTSEVTDNYISNGVATVLPLTYQLSTHHGIVTNQGVNEPIGVTTPPYWVADATANTITRSSAPVNLNAISITYIAQFPYVTQANDTGEQAANGIWERVAPPLTTVFNAATALDIARGYLLRSTVTSKTVKYVTRQLGIKPGQTQTITVAGRNISGSFLITDVQTTSLPTQIPTVQRTVTAVGGTQFPGSWQDKFKSWGGAMTSGTTVGGNITIIEGGGGSSGTGTVGKLAKWTATDTLGDSVFTESGGAFTSGATGAGFTIALSASTVTGTLADARLTSNVPLKDAALNIFTGAMTVEDTFTNELIVTPSGAVGAANAGLAALSAGAGSGAPTNLTLAPTGDLITDPGGNEILPTLNYDINIGRLDKKYLTLHAAELWVETLVAQDVMATIGGRIIVAPTTQLILDLSSAAVPTGTMYVKHNNIGISDIVRMEAGGKVEFMQAASGATAVAGGYSYLMTRNLDGTGANDWFAGDALVVTNMFIDVYSTTGVLSGFGPTITGNVRTGTTFNQIEPRWAIGNLNGLYGYGVDTYGAAFGSPSAAWLKIDPTSGVRIGHAGNVFAQITAAGSASFTGSVTVTGGNAETTSGAQTKATLAETNATAVANQKALKDLSDTTANWAGSTTPGGPSTRVTGIVDAAPTFAGLYLGYDFLGYYNGASWRTYMDNAGNFYLGGTAGALQWNGTALTIIGSGIFTGTVTAASGTVTLDTSGVTVLSPVAYANVNAYKFSSGFAGTSQFGLFSRDVTSSARDVQVWNSTNQTGKTVSTAVKADSSALSAGITLTATDTTAAIELTAISGVTINRTFCAFAEKVTTPATPAANDSWHAYAKSDKFILQFNNAGTVNYYYLDGTAASGSWTHTTTAP